MDKNQFKYYTTGTINTCKVIGEGLKKRGKIKDYEVRESKTGVHRIYVQGLIIRRGSRK
jgi:hypothetical protein